MMCLGCERRIHGEPAVIFNLPTQRSRPVCDRCSLRARESSIFFEQLARTLGLGHTVPSLRHQIHPRELPTTLAGWDAFEADATMQGGAR
jgi:hypothetical protein